MSVFDQTTGQDAVTTEQVSPEATPTTESFVAKLVETRGEKWGDPETIAKGKLEADNHIVELERQLTEMREDLSKQDYSKSLLEQLQNKAGATANKPVVSSGPEGGVVEANTTPDAAKLESLVEATLQKREAEATTKSNIAAVDAALTEAFGTEASKVVVEKAKELGMTLDRMQAIAAESPNAFLRLVGDVAPVVKPVAQTTAVNSQAKLNNSGNKTWSDYQALRRSNPTQYYSPSVQREIVAMRDKQGTGFFQS